MGRLFLVDLEHFDDQKFQFIAVCRTCHTHIAVLPNYVYFDLPEGQFGPTFTKVVNVLVDGPENHRDVGQRTLANAYCVKCGARLGVKYERIEVAGVENVHVRRGYYHMPLRKLSLTDGERYRNFEDCVREGHLGN